ncbi:MAG: SH3 domain-containing protein [Thermomicrobiales bacterium]
MDAPRFDALARAFSSAPSRRSLLKAMSVMAAGAAVLRPAVVNADTAVGGSQTVDTTGTGGTTESTGGTDTGGTAVCLPITRNGTDAGFAPPFFAEIIEGSCDTADGSSVFELLDIEANEGMTAVPPAALMGRSVTTVESSLQDLIDTRHSIVVRASIDDPSLVACGEIGGNLQGDELAAGVRERNNSGFSGVSLLRGTNGSTLVYVFLGQGLSTVTTAAAAIGSVVVTTADVNLREQPAVDSAIITVIPTGSELSVTGASVGEWVPVEVPGTGEAGYVSGQFVEVVS